MPRRRFAGTRKLGEQMTQVWIKAIAKPPGSEQHVINVVVGGDEYHNEVTLAIEPEQVIEASELKSLVKALNDSKDLVESSVSHVSHGGPTTAHAEAWLELART